MQPWSMNEVMLLGILVALIKIAQLADVIPGIGMYAVGAARRCCSPRSRSTFDPHAIWTRVEWADGTDSPRRPMPGPRRERAERRG